MKCIGCDDRRTGSRAGVREHHCRYTGAQVAEFAFDATDTRGQCRPDDPNYLCPRTLDALLLSRAVDHLERNLLVAGVLETVWQRGELEHLLATYSPLVAAQLEAVWQAWRGQPTTSETI